MFYFIVYSKRKSFDIMSYKIFEHKETETLNLNEMTGDKLNFQRLMNN